MSKPIVDSARSYAQVLSRLARPQNVIFPGLLAMIAARVSGTGWLRPIVCYALIASLYAVAAGLNNIQDKKIDSNNQRTDNPLTSVRLSRIQLASFFTAHLVIIGVSQFWLRQPASILLSVAYIVLITAYSLPQPSLQSRGFLATVCLAACYGSIPLLLGSLQSPEHIRHLGLLAGLQIMLLSPLLLAKDYKDIVGDMAYGKRTPLVRYGKRGVIGATSVCLFISAVIIAHSIIYRSLPPYIGLAGAGYICLVAYIHYRDGNRTLVITRLCQLALLVISWQFLVN